MKFRRLPTGVYMLAITVIAFLVIFLGCSTIDATPKPTLSVTTDPHYPTITVEVKNRVPDTDYGHLIVLDGCDAGDADYLTDIWTWDGSKVKVMNSKRVGVKLIPSINSVDFPALDKVEGYCY